MIIINRLINELWPLLWRLGLADSVRLAVGTTSGMDGGAFRGLLAASQRQPPAFYPGNLGTSCLTFLFPGFNF